MPAERPLTIFLDGRELVTLMTLGARPEFLALGYLRNQRLIADVTTIESIMVDWAAGSADVRTRVAGTFGTFGRRTADILCGLGLDRAMLPPTSSARITRSTLLRVLDTARQYDAIHRAAGSVHSCALFQGPDLLAAVEDVSRHNGVDTVTGWMALHGVPGGDKILFTTGRLTGEMVTKAAYNGIPIIVSRNGVTGMGHDVAAKLGMTLIARAANRRFFCYVGGERFDAESGVD